MIWRLDGGTTVSDAGVRIRRMGRDVLRYEVGSRYIDFTFEFGFTGASVYTREVVAWQPDGQAFTSADREIVEQHLRDALHINGYAEVDFGNYVDGPGLS